MNLKSSIILFSLSLLLFSCASSGSSSGNPKHQPDWVGDKHSLYPENKYLVEIGEGTSLEKAKQNGKASLARIFKTRIVVDSTLRTRYRDLSDGDAILESEVETTLDDSITQLSDETLINVNFGESWTDELGRVYVVAYIDRVKTADIYRQRIEKDSQKADYFMRRSAEQDSIMARYGFLSGAIVMDTAMRSKMEHLEILYAPYARMIMLPYNQEELYSLFSESAREMRYSIAIEGDQDDRILSIVSQVLTDRGFTVSPSAAPLSVSGRILIEEVPLNNEYENIRWTLFLEMKNENGESVVTLEEGKRETAVSTEAAYARAYRSMETVMNKKFLGEMEAYLDRIAVK